MPINDLDLLDRLDWQRHEAEVIAKIRQAAGCYVAGKNGSHRVPGCGVAV